MDIQNLNAFLQVAERRSFSAAADALHLTQPAVSKRVAALENQLGASLFDRMGRAVTLTEAGRALLPHAREIAGELARAQQSIDDLGGSVSGRLRLATSHHIGLHRLPPVLRSFSERYPDVSLDIDFIDSEQAFDAVHRGRAELAIVTLPPAPDPALHSRCLWPDPLDFMVSAEHPLARALKPGLSQLSEHPAVLPGLSTFTGQIAREAFESRGLTLDVSLSTNYLETIRMMASVGLGWTLLPRDMLQPPLEVLKVPGLQLSRELGLVHHRSRQLSNAASAFISLLP
ncbi:MAG: LysR family transcriptional regulator [Halieaceae bacterium]|jgi:DNA-binding transcriptional LysR family regulator|nr:LysR family transcriptional regulator [Halieaceae bacterium]